MPSHHLGAVYVFTDEHISSHSDLESRPACYMLSRERLCAAREEEYRP